MDAREYAARFLEYGRIADVHEFARVVEGGIEYPLLVATTPGRRTLLVTSGFHGNETAGPMTLLEQFPALVEYARRRDVGLRVYPCLNPSGFEDNTRYNRSGERPNNDFLRYEIEPGCWVDVLRGRGPFLQFAPHRGGPKETRALLAELEHAPLPAAALDIHQDPWMEDRLSYAYTFGPRHAYLPLVAEADRLVPVAREAEVDDDLHTDADGLIELHDGSVTDYMYRRGVRYAAALETTTTTPAALSNEVNLRWLYGFVELAAQ
jgi:hypothetical protein